MPNRSFTSMIPPDIPVPEPPEWDWIKKAGTGCFVVVMLLIIGFIFIDFSFDISGHPLDFNVKEPALPPPEKIEVSKVRGSAENVKNVLEQTVLITPARKCRIRNNNNGTDKNAANSNTVVPFLYKWDTGRGKKDTEPPFPLHLFADGLPVEWDAKFGKTVFFAAVKLPPGLHRLHTSVHEIEVFVENKTSSEQQKTQPIRYSGWKEFRFHSGTDDASRCDECHKHKENTDEVLAGKNCFAPVVEWKGGQYCADCHKNFNFQETHKHTVEVYKDCRKCHSVHGTMSGEEHLLRDSLAFFLFSARNLGRRRNVISGG
ncbi:hypothetical protein FACS18942_09200 [Planctomycetales bacterium]|nr:hypothetical protein FACS18942_09200 [Planctomycetales bacterium]